MSLALLFAGQGAQKTGMGRSLYASSPAARALYDEADGVLGWSVSKVSFDGPEAELTQTGVCQPALYVHGMALVAALREERGDAFKPSMALGLSLGELTAYAVAGVFDFQTGLRIVAERGRLMQRACEQTSGGMAAILGEERASVLDLCREFEIDAANFNAPGQIIVSGERGRVEAAVAAAKSRGIKKIMHLNVAGAYHSRLMEPARGAFARFLEPLGFAPPRLPVFANATGLAAGDPEAIKAALVLQVVSPVLWEDCMRAAVAAGATEFLELGPGGILAGLARRTDRGWRVRTISEFGDLAG
jgi:[acyl-carrier-protein] S-malonyltransferase